MLFVLFSDNLTIKADRPACARHVQSMVIANDHYQSIGIVCLSIIRGHSTCRMPPDYWQSDNSNGLVMVIRNYHWLNTASRVLISTCSTPLVQMTKCGNKTQFFTVWSWPTTFTYNPRLAKVKVDPRAKDQGQWFKQESAHRQTDEHRRAHTRTLPNVLSPCYVVDKYPQLRVIVTWYFMTGYWTAVIFLVVIIFLVFAILLLSFKCLLFVTQRFLLKPYCLLFMQSSISRSTFSLWCQASTCTVSLLHSGRFTILNEQTKWRVCAVFK